MPSANMVITPAQRSSINLALALPIRMLDRPMPMLVARPSLAVKLRLDNVSVMLSRKYGCTHDVLVVRLADFFGDVGICYPPSVTGVFDVKTAIMLAEILCVFSVELS